MVLAEESTFLLLIQLQRKVINNEEPIIRMECEIDQAKYNIQHLEVIALYSGARGTISKSFVNFLKQFRILVQ